MWMPGCENGQGIKVYEMMWEPLVVGKFGERYYKQVNMAWMWARLKARTTRLGTFEGGFQNFADMFAEKLRETGSRNQTPVSRDADRAGRKCGWNFHPWEK